MKELDKVTQRTKKKVNEKGVEDRTAQYRETASRRIKERQKAQRLVYRPQFSAKKYIKLLEIIEILY